MNLKNKKIIITGATGGIGHSLVETFNAQGSIVVATGTNETKLENLKKNFNKIHAEKFNLSDHEKIEGFIDKIDKQKMKEMSKKNPAMAHSHSNSVLLSPGEKGQIIWKFSNSEDIEVACNVPGHYDVGMIAKIDNM